LRLGNPDQLPGVLAADVIADNPRLLIDGTEQALKDVVRHADVSTRVPGGASWTADVAFAMYVLAMSPLVTFS